MYKKVKTPIVAVDSDIEFKAITNVLIVTDCSGVIVELIELSDSLVVLSDISYIIN